MGHKNQTGHDEVVSLVLFLFVSCVVLADVMQTIPGLSGRGHGVPYTVQGNVI